MEKEKFAVFWFPMARINAEISRLKKLMEDHPLDIKILNRKLKSYSRYIEKLEKYCKELEGLGFLVYKTKDNPWITQPMLWVGTSTYMGEEKIQLYIEYVKNLKNK